MDNKSQNDFTNGRPLEGYSNQDFFAYADKKTEKIVAALYLITTILSDNDPMKWQLREKATRFLSTVLLLSSRTRSTTPVLVNDVETLGHDIISLLEVSRIAQLVSDMNCQIVSKEIRLFLENVSSALAEKSFPSQSLFTQDFFWPSTQHKESSIDERTPRDSASNSLKKPASYALGRGLSKGQNSGQTAPQKPIKLPALRTSEDTPKGDRKSIILKLAKEQAFLSVKDVAFVVKNCSEKTIQRELLALVGDGILKKEGERRWSKYSLA